MLSKSEAVGEQLYDSFKEIQKNKSNLWEQLQKNILMKPLQNWFDKWNYYDKI